MIRSFTYSALAEQTLDFLQRVTGARNKNQLFEPMVESMLRSTLLDPEAPEITQEDIRTGQELKAAWDHIRRAETMRSSGIPATGEAGR